MIMHDPHYLRLARELCDRYAVHLICDEIMAGFGRTGTFFAHEQAGIRPDFLCLSKGLTSGYLPLSVVMTTDEVYAAFYDDTLARGFLHSHSYTGNPLACRAALTTLDIFAEDDVLARNRRFARRVGAQPAFRQAVHRFAGPLGQASAGAEFPPDRNDLGGRHRHQRPRFYRNALRHEILLRPLGTTVYFMPPYILDDQEAVLLAERAIQTLDATLP